MTNAYGKLLDEIAEYESQHDGQKPAKIRLTPHDEAEFGRLGGDEFALAWAIADFGVRKAILNLDGIPVEWGARRHELIP